MRVIYVLKDPTIAHLSPLDIRYVGFTSRPLSKRLSGHINDIKRLPHLRKSRWLNKLNENGLFPIVEIIEELSNEQNWRESEIKYVAYYRNIGCDLTNLTDGGDGTMGFIHSKETREKISNTLRNKEKSEKQIASLHNLHENNRGKIRKPKKIKIKLPRKLSEKHKSNIGKGLIGHIVTEETRTKIQKANTGKIRPIEAIKITREKNSGKKRSEEFCRRQAELKTGKKMSDETKEKIRIAKTGSKLSEDIKQKISSSLKKHYENNIVSDKL